MDFRRRKPESRVLWEENSGPETYIEQWDCDGTTLRPEGTFQEDNHYRYKGKRIE